MFGKLKQLVYGARVLLSQGSGTPETISLFGRSSTLLHAGTGPAFVYLHSTLGESFKWLPFYQAWAKHFHVYVPTHPGFWQSEGFEQIDTIEDLAFHYIELFDALGLDEVYLGGVSLGGWIAAEIAVRWPERVRKLWLTGCPGLWVEHAPPADLFRLAADRDKLRALLFHDPHSALAKLIIADQTDEATLLATYQHLTVLARLVWERPYDPKLAGRLRRVTCPTLLLWGEHDRLVPAAHAEAYRQHLPNAQVQLIRACGHLPMFEKEAEFVAAVQKFCQE